MARMCFLLLLFASLGLWVAPLPARAQTSSQKSAGKAKKKAGQKPIPASDAAPAADAAKDFPLRSITVEGNKILPAAAIVQASEVKIGDKVDKALFDGAQARLLATGYFESAGYTYKSSEDNKAYDATFKVVEIQSRFPLRIEALPESQEAVLAWLKQTDPLFDGKCPGTQLVLERTVREVEQFLASKNRPMKVTAKVVALAPEKFEIQVQPSTGLAAVSEVTFEGNKAISNTQLSNAIADVAFGQPYTETGFRQLLENQIRPRYEAKGYLGVKFTKVSTSPSTRVKGLDVKVNIEEGAEYKLGNLELKAHGEEGGAVQDDAARILKIAKVPKMTVADFDQLKLAADRVQEEMKHRGFLQATVTVDKKLNEAKKSVDVFFLVETGPEFRFRKLTVLGLGLDGEAAIRKMWGVKEGDAFPAEYPNYFLTKVKEDGLFDNLGDTKAVPARDDANRVVDVTLDFKAAPQKPVRKPRQPGNPMALLL